MGLGNRAYRIRMLVTVLVALAASFGVASAASAQELDVSTQPALYPAFDPAITDYVVRCTPGSPVDVTVAASPGTAADVDGQGPRTGTFTTAVKLNPGQGLRIFATPGPAATTYYVRCLPSDFPASTFQRSGEPQAEWYAVEPVARTNFQPGPPGVSRAYVALFDANGVPVWWLKTPIRGADFRVLQNGNVAWVLGGSGGGQEHRLDGSLERVVTPVDALTDPHEFMMLPNGNYLITTLRTIPGLTPCGQSDAQILDSGAQEIAPDGSVVWSWWASDHIAASEFPSVWCGAQDSRGRYDPYHINSIDRDGDSYIASFRHLDAVYKINQADGGILWKLGGTPRPESLTVVGDPFAAGDEFRGQHDARVLSDDTVTIHDNGFHPPSSTRPPRAVRYAIDADARTATLVEQKNDPGAVATPLCCGSARKLPGGNWVMSWGNTGVITELSPSGSRIVSLTFDDGLFSYRAHPVPFGELTRTAVRAGMDAQFPRGYPRPAAAGKVRMPLVPAYEQCLSPDLMHGPPLEYGSCSSPGTSSFLTVGTFDANGASAKSVGFVTYKVAVGDPSTPASESDVRLTVSLTDVRRKSDLSDYTGELQVQGAVRITDKANGPLQNEAATGFATDFPAAVPCVATDRTTVGSTCSLISSFNAIVPGTVVERKRATWQLGEVQVFDGGASEVAGGQGASLFATQGIFVP